MKQQPRIIELTQKKLVGMSAEMSRINDKTAALWRAFMARRHEVANRSDQDYISMQVFPDGPRQLSDPAATFAKWAVVEVHSFESVADGMTTYTLQPGMYAVFEHNGPATDLSTFMYVFTEWLPGSDTYELDDREHFEVLPPDYDPRNPNAKEEIWIPIKLRKRSSTATQRAKRRVRSAPPESTARLQVTSAGLAFAVLILGLMLAGVSQLYFAPDTEFARFIASGPGLAVLFVALVVLGGVIGMVFELFGLALFRRPTDGRK